MTLVEVTYSELREAGLVTTREQFSTQYVGKNPNWYSYQIHVGRDFSVSAAIECLRHIRNAANNETLATAQRLALLTAERLLLQQLNKQYSVAEVTSMPTYRAQNQFAPL
jgi:DNA-binding transcriptional ArsR family regulator